MSQRRPARGTRPQGQWASGETEPLNAVERVKRDGGGLDVRERVERRYAAEGVGAIGDDDLRERLKWWGLYTQRRQDAPATMTGGPPEDLTDEHFMMRVRIDGGRLTSDQLRAVAWASRRHGRDVADVTDRQNVQLHWIRIEDVPEIWRRLEAVGLTTAMACGDVPRGFLGCPVAGRDAAEVVDATPLLSEVRKRSVANPEFANLPRKFKTSISGCAQQCAQPALNDVAFVGLRAPGAGGRADGAVGFDLLVGGGLGANPHFARRLGAFVPPDAVPDVWEAVARLFRDHGYRRSRKRARLKFLVADWGPQRVREVLERDYLGAALPDGPPAPPSPGAQRDHVGVFAQSDGNRYVGVAPRAGRVAGHQLAAVADLADRFGSGLVRLTTQQKIVLLDVDPAAADELLAALDALDLRARAGAFRTGTMSCTGLEFCKLALAETKGNADALYRELERRLPEWDEELRIHLNGCPNSCARFQVADIGLMGALVPRPDGSRGEGFLVHLGGALGGAQAFGEKVRGVRVPAEDLADYVETLLRRYLARADGHAGFSDFVRSLDAAELEAFAAPEETP
ncbi:MAG: nitrite/sulfite reductase [Actinomycetota bacterium]|nr:nitrite/sulfite reductase [Actinomycetota bacterium]